MDALLVYALRMGLKFTTFGGRKKKPTTQLKILPLFGRKASKQNPPNPYMLANKNPKIHTCLKIYSTPSYILTSYFTY